MGYGVCVSACEEQEFYDVVESRLMAMAMAAHKEVLYEKIKQKIEQEEGAKLDKIAELLVEASQKKWKSERDERRTYEELHEKIKETFEQ